MTHIDIRPEPKRVRVTLRGEVIADTADALALKEGSYPVVYYIPRKDVKMDRLARTTHSTHCPRTRGMRRISPSRTVRRTRSGATSSRRTAWRRSRATSRSIPTKSIRSRPADVPLLH
jgi:hypothetical protein